MKITVDFIGSLNTRSISQLETFMSKNKNTFNDRRFKLIDPHFESSRGKFPNFGKLFQQFFLINWKIDFV